VYPNGEDNEKKSHFSVFLVNESRETVMVDSIWWYVGNENARKFPDPVCIKSRSGCGQNYSHAKCKSLLKDGALEVKVEVQMLGDRVQMNHDTQPKPDRSGWVLRNLYRSSMPLADFRVVCGGEAVPCHRAVLVGASGFFRGVMKPDTREYKEGRVTLECSAEVGRGFIQFLYTNKIEPKILDDNLEDFLKLGDMYMMDELKEVVEDRMLHLLDRDNMVVFFKAGDMFRAERVRAEAKGFIKVNLDWLSRKEDCWMESFGDEKDLVIELLHK
jgi:hypothetical protein